MTKIKRIKIDEAIQKWNDDNPDKDSLTREKLAEQINVSYSLINNLQSGRVGKGYQIMNQLSEALDCSIDELIEKS